MCNRSFLAALAFLSLAGGVTAAQSDWGIVAKAYSSTAGFHDVYHFAVSPKTVNSEIRTRRNLNGVKADLNWKHDLDDVTRRVGKPKSKRYGKLLESLPVILSVESIAYTLDKWELGHITTQAIEYLKEEKTGLNELANYANVLTGEQELLRDLDNDPGFDDQQSLLGAALLGLALNAQREGAANRFQSALFGDAQRVRNSVIQALASQLREEPRSSQQLSRSLLYFAVYDTKQSKRRLWIENKSTTSIEDISIIVERAAFGETKVYYFKKLLAGETYFIQLPNKRHGGQDWSISDYRMLVADSSGVVFDGVLKPRSHRRIDTFLVGAQRELLQTTQEARDGNQLLEEAKDAISQSHTRLRERTKSFRKDVAAWRKNVKLPGAKKAATAVYESIKSSQLPSSSADVEATLGALDDEAKEAILPAVLDFEDDVRAMRRSVLRRLKHLEANAATLDLQSTKNRIQEARKLVAESKPLESIPFREALDAATNETSSVLNAYQLFSKYVELTDRELARIERRLFEDIKGKAKGSKIESKDLSPIKQLQGGMIPSDAEVDFSEIKKRNSQFAAALNRLRESDAGNQKLHNAIEEIHMQSKTLFGALSSK